MPYPYISSDFHYFYIQLFINSKGKERKEGIQHTQKEIPTDSSLVSKKEHSRF